MEIKLKHFFVMMIIFCVAFGYNLNSFWNATSWRGIMLSLAFILPSLIGIFISFKAMFLFISRDYKKINKRASLFEKKN